MFKFIKNFLKRLEEENKKSFGNGRLDCCDLNRSNNANQSDNKNK